jgi:hypothetical protein
LIEPRRREILPVWLEEWLMTEHNASHLSVKAFHWAERGVSREGRDNQMEMRRLPISRAVTNEGEANEACINITELLACFYGVCRTFWRSDSFHHSLFSNMRKRHFHFEIPKTRNIRMIARRKDALWETLADSTICSDGLIGVGESMYKRFPVHPFPVCEDLCCVAMVNNS